MFKNHDGRTRGMALAMAGLALATSLARADDKPFLAPGLAGLLGGPMLVKLPEGQTEVVCFVDATEVQALNTINAMSKEGWWPQTVAVSGPQEAERFAVVMLRRKGEPPRERHVRAFRLGKNDYSPTPGCGPISVSASGNYFVIVEEKDDTPGALTLTMSAKQWSDEAESFYRRYDTMKSVAVGQNAGQTVYATIYRPTDGPNLAWTAEPDLSLEQAKQHFDIWRNQGRVRLADIAIQPDGKFLQLWRDDDFGAWAAYADLTRDELNAKIQALQQQGLVPTALRATGSGDATRYAAIFSRRLVAVERTFRAVGSPPIAAIDNQVKKFMRDNGARHAQLAVCIGPRLVYSRAYSMIGTGDVPCDEKTTIRQASCSKPFLAASVYRLIASKPLVPGTKQLFTLDTKVQDVLQLQPVPGQKALSPEFGSLTVRQLIAHRSGLGDDYIASDADVAAAFDGTYPVTQLQIARYAACQPFKNAPSDSGPIDYNNTNSLLLALVLKTVSGDASDFAAEKRWLFDPLGLKTVRGARTSWANQPKNEAFYAPRFNYPDDWNNWNTLRRNNRLGLGWDYSGAEPVLSTNGYGIYNMENSSGPGGLSMNALDAVRLAAFLSVPGAGGILSASTDPKQREADRQKFFADCQSGGRYAFDSTTAAPGGAFIAYKGGSLPASGNVLRCNTGGVSFSISAGVSATEPPSYYPTNDDLVNAITSNKSSWDGTDLWTKYGSTPVASPTSPPAPSNPALLAFEKSLPKRSLWSTETEASHVSVDAWRRPASARRRRNRPVFPGNFSR